MIPWFPYPLLLFSGFAFMNSTSAATDRDLRFDSPHSFHLVLINRSPSPSMFISLVKTRIISMTGGTPPDSIHFDGRVAGNAT
jgi:hypothetical protein